MQFSAEPVGGQAAVDDLVPAPRRGQDIADTLYGRGALSIACAGCPSARECEIITVPDRADRHIQRGGQL